MDGSDQIYQGPDGSALRFFYTPSKNNFQSEKHGRPIFDTSLMVEVMVPGSRESSPTFEVERVYSAEASGGEDRKVEKTYKYEMYKQQIEAFKSQNGEGLVNGTPLSQWPQVDTGTAATLKAAGIHTVEMLAGVQDGHLQNLGMGGRVLREQARAFLNTRQFSVPSAQMAAEQAQLREECTRLQGQVNDLTSRLNTALAENQQLKGGHPVASTSAAQADPFANTTISQPNPFASMDSGSASPLTPNEGEVNENAQSQPGGGGSPPLI